jgi:hypothetical protein
MVVKVATEIMIAIMAIPFVTVLLSLLTVVPVVITPVVAASVVVVIIAAVVELAIIIAGRVCAIAVVASISSWIDTRSYVVSAIIVAYLVVWAGGCA